MDSRLESHRAWWVLAAGVLLHVLALSACTAPPEPAPTHAPARAVLLRNNQDEITCGPFVDGVADFGRDFAAGRCRGESCTDACGCVCLQCSDDSGICYGLCSSLEGCEALSEPPGRWEVVLDERVLVATEP